ncbi:MAG: hypothetical protein AAGL99_03730 [Pseudomonadota bacterium]
MAIFYEATMGDSNIPICINFEQVSAIRRSADGRAIVLLGGDPEVGQVTYVLNDTYDEIVSHLLD